MKFVPNDSKYVPLTQQKYLCTPTCIQMVMLRHNIPLVPAEVIGNMMGLIVPEEGLKYFWNAKTGEKPRAGWGTQAGKSQYGPNAVFKKLGIPLKMSWSLENTFKNIEDLYKYLKKIKNKDIDILICFDWGKLLGKEKSGQGHLCVLDKIDLEKNEVRIIDPEYDAPKWRTVKINKLYDAIKVHGKERSGGFWELSLKQ